MSSIIPNTTTSLQSTDNKTRPTNPQLNSSLFTLLPPELRLCIYDAVINPTKSRSLYITRDVWTWKDPKTTRRFMNVLLVCRRMYDEAVEILYHRHELLFYSSHWALQTRVGALRDYTCVFQRAQRMRLTLFVTGERERDDVIIALLGWLKAVLAERETPLKLLTLEFCAISPTLESKPTAVLYAAQGFRSLGPTKFKFQCGFSGVGSEDAMEALMQHANEKIRAPVKMPMGREEAFERYLAAWGKCQPGGLESQRALGTKRIRVTRAWYDIWLRRLSNRWLGTRFQVVM